MWDKLPREVKKELEDPKYINRTHGSRATSAAKCHGPLCRKAERDRTNQKHKEKQAAKGLEVKSRERTKSEVAHDLLLTEIINWHRSERGLEPIKGEENATAQG